MSLGKYFYVKNRLEEIEPIIRDLNLRYYELTFDEQCELFDLEDEMVNLIDIQISHGQGVFING